MKKENRKKRRSFRKYDGLKYGWLKDAEKFLLLLAVVSLLFRFVIGFSIVRGSSMESTLYNGEVVMYLRLHSKCRIGDVVSVRTPSGQYYVKRVIAAGGDTIEIRENQVYVNDEPLDEPYVVGESKPQAGAVRYPVTLEEGQIFVMGDNREESVDSRTFGVVGERQIKGKLLFRAGRFYIRTVQ